MSNEKYFDTKLIMENMKDIISQTDENGVFQYISPSCSKAMGYSQSSLIGKSAFNYIHPDDRSTILALFQEGIDTKSENCVEYRFQHAQGHYIWLETAGKVLLDHEGEVVGAILVNRDITKRKTLDEKQKSFFSLSVDMLGIANAEGYLVDINDAWESSLGWSIEELLSKPYLNFVHSDDREATIQMADKLMNGEKVYSFINRYLCKDGSHKWISWNSSPNTEGNLIYFVARDVTKQIHKEKALKERVIHSESFLRSVIDNIQGVVYRCKNDKEWTMEYLSKRCFDLTEYNAEELIANSKVSFSSLVSDMQRNRMLSQNNPVYEHEYLITTKSGEEKWVLDRGRKIFSEDGQAIAREGILTDVTERKQLEEQVIESQRLYQSVVDTQQEMVCRYLPDTTLTFVNDAYCRAFGKSSQELLGQKYLMFIPPEHHEDELASLKRLYPAHPSDTREFEVIDSNDNTHWQEWTDVAVFNESGELKEIQGTGHDITKRKQAEDEMRRQSNRTETLLKAASLLNANMELKTIYHTICEEICTALHVPLSFFLRYDRISQVFHLVDGSGLASDLALTKEILSRESFDEVMQSVGKAGIVTALTLEPNPPAYAELIQKHEIKKLAYAVIERKGLTLGILVAGAGEDFNNPNDTITLLAGLADQTASAVTNAMLIKETQERLLRIQALRNIDLAITGSLDLRVTFQVVLDEVTKMLKTDAAAILRLDPYTGTLKYEQTRGFQNKDIDRISIPLDVGHAGRTAFNRKSVHIHDLRDSRQDLMLTPFIIDEGFVDYYAVPLIAKGTILGVLEVFHRETLDSSGEWLAFLETLAGQAAIAVDNAELFTKLERANVDLLRAYDATIEGWAHALDLKDEETEEHSRRVTELTMRIARKLRIKEAELAHVRRGALLHDIGKMGIPDSILLKPGKLTDEEWEFMRKHPVFAFEMLSPIDYLRPALDIPYCHHEKWDGSGYPRGLKGEQIPLAARIFAIVDVYDALTSDRPYRKAWSKEKTLEHIREQSGKHFDPHVLDVFVKEIGGL